MKELRKVTIFNIILLIFLLSFISQLDYSTAQINGEHLEEPYNFTFEEYTEKVGNEDNLTSVDISLPSNNWNITSLNLNFSNIKLEREVKSIEDQPQGTYGRIYYNTPSKRRHGLGVQINLTETTTIFGAYIYAYKPETTTQIIQVQIRGYDNGNNKPNDTIYTFTEINVSSIPGWYYQNFNAPVKLSKGNYYLVIFGIVSGNTEYYWAYNAYEPKHPSLYASEYTGDWLTGDQNAPYLYKLVQKLDRSYNPEDINMSAKINGVDYDVLNSSSPYSGVISVSGLNWNTNYSNIHIPINNDLHIELNFSLNYHIALINEFISSGSVLIQANKDNIWTIAPTFNRLNENYSVKFYYPSNWNNLTVYRNNVNISSLIIINPSQKSLFIENDTIIDGAEWLISANSPRFNFNLDIRRTEYEPGQELIFSIDIPAPSGNYTLVLYNTDHYEIEDARQTISYPLDDTFSFVLPTHSIEGEYYAYVYFFDGINAGVETVSFLITIPFTIDPTLLFIIILTSALVISVAISIVVTVKRHKRKVDAYKEEIFNKCMDILNLNYIMVSEKKSSLNVYEQVFTKQKLDATLISGFLSAIHSFGIELTNTDDKTQTIKLEYKNSKVLMSEFKDFRIVIIMNDIPSQKFFDSISNLAFDIELYYSRYLENFKGNIDPFKGIENLLKKHLNISFLYPLKIVKTGKTKVSPVEKMIIGRALESMKKSKQNYFYITHIMELKTCDSKDIEAIFNLIDKNIFQTVI